MKIPVLIYHNILPTKDLTLLPQGERYYSVASEIFEDHLSFLHAEGYQTIQIGTPLSDVPRPVVLTFDDGFKSAYWCYQNLKKYGFQGIFFIVTSFVGQHSYLSWDEIREMNANGMSIQSHTCNHLILTDISSKQIQSEFSLSKAILEDKLGHLVESLSIPHGFISKDIIDIARQCGYKYIFISQPGLYASGSMGPINRLTIYYHTKAGSFRRLVNQSAYEIGKQQMRKLVLGIPKSILGDKAYHRVHQNIMHWIDR